MNQRSHDFVVIGAGIAGASLAYRLVTHGSVLLLERESQPGYHSTGRSAAMFMETYGTPQIRALTRASRAFYEQPPEGFGEYPLMRPRGALYLAQQGQEALLEDAYAAARAIAPDARRLSPVEALAVLPVARQETLIGAMLEPGAQDLDVHALHQGFLHGFRRRRGTVLTQAEVVAARRSADAWDIELADDRRIRASILVNAAGAWADKVAELCGVPTIGLQPKRRTAFTFAPPDGVDCSSWPAVVGIDESYYFKPDAGQLLGSPANADPVEPHDVVAEELDVATGIHRIETATTLTIRRPQHTWAGLRSFVRDGELVIGWDNHREGFFWLGAQGGYGVQSAAAASELAEAQLMRTSIPHTLVRHGVTAEAMWPNRLR
jgi:D-arginine dehydrogenase